MPHSPTAPLPAPPWRDRKRPAWLMSLLVPCTVGIGPALMLISGQLWTLWLPAVFFYGLAPLIDRWLGEDQSNPPESAVPALDADPYYRWITYLLVPLLWASFIFSAWFVATQALPWHGVLAMVLICGSVGGFCINLGHELGPRGHVEKHLGRRSQLQIVAIEEDRPHGIASRGRAGVAAGGHRVALRCEPLHERPDLRRLARAIDPVERDESGR